jgi:hypothetical protein
MMSHGWTLKRSRRAGIGLVLLLAMLSACGHSAQRTATLSPTATATPTPTATATATPTAALVVPALCGTDGGSPVTASGAGPHDAIHSLRFEHLPDEWTLIPHPFPMDMWFQYPEVTVGSSVPLSIYPSIGTATQPGIICGMTVRIKDFQPLPGSVPNVYHWCVDQVYLDPGGFHPSTACPAFHAPAGEGGLTLPSSVVGTTVTANINGLKSDYSLDLDHPAQIPNDVNGQLRPYLGIGIVVPAAGTYTLEISLWQDSSRPTVTMPDVTETLLLNQALHEWGGQQCTTPDMQALLPPPTDPPTPLICPGPPPK